MTAPLARRSVLGRYELDTVIGRGGASTVYRAVDGVEMRHVAVKEIPVGHEMARRAGAEVRAACLLDHPGLVRLLDFGEDAHAAYLVSELVEGQTLARHYRARDLDDAQVLAAMADVFGGLAHAHERGVTHRDIKPGNILFDPTGRAKLADFGIARIVGDQGLTHTGGLVGTMAYMAPEHARGEPTGPASDVYSACLVLREGLTGGNPIAGGNQLETLRRAGAPQLTPLAVERPDLPRRLSEAIDAGLDRDPARRPSALQLAEALERVVAGGAPTRIVRPPAARPRPARAAAAVSAPGRAAGAVTVAIVVAMAARRYGDLDPATVAAFAAGTGAAFAFAPWSTTAVGWIVAMGLLWSAAPALAGVLGVVGLVAILPLRRRGHLLAIPIGAPVLAAAGLAPLAMFLAGLVPGTFRRLQTAAAAAGAALTWQLIAGADPALDGGRLLGAWPFVRDRADPVAVVGEIVDVAAARTSVPVAALVLAGAALVVPAIVRLRRVAARVVAVGAWVGAMVVAIAVAGGSVENALGAMIPGGILVAVGAAVPWERLRSRGRPLQAVTLGATMEREPTA